MAGHRIRDDISTKSGKLAGRGWGGSEGAKRWQITRRGWGGGGRGGKAWAQRRHIHENWQFGQGGADVAQRESRGGKSLGGPGVRSWVARHDNRSATATVTWTARRGDFWDRGPGFESGIPHNDHGVLQDHCVIL